MPVKCFILGLCIFYIFCIISEYMYVILNTILIKMFTLILEWYLCTTFYVYTQSTLNLVCTYFIVYIISIKFIQNAYLKWSCNATFKSKESLLSSNPIPIKALRPKIKNMQISNYNYFNKVLIIRTYYVTSIKSWIQWKNIHHFRHS